MGIKLKLSAKGNGFSCMDLMKARLPDLIHRQKQGVKIDIDRGHHICPCPFTGSVNFCEPLYKYGIFFSVSRAGGREFMLFMLVHKYVN